MRQVVPTSFSHCSSPCWIQNHFVLMTLFVPLFILVFYIHPDFASLLSYYDWFGGECAKGYPSIPLTSRLRFSFWGIWDPKSKLLKLSNMLMGGSEQSGSENMMWEIIVVIPLCLAVHVQKSLFLKVTSLPNLGSERWKETWDNSHLGQASPPFMSYKWQYSMSFWL